MNATVLEICGVDGGPDRIVSGAVATGFIEGQTYLLSVCGHGDALLVDDVPLVRADNGNAFIWQPGFFAGRVLAETVGADGRTLDVFHLDVGPTPHKLGQPRFQRMVDELLTFRPELLLGTEPAHSPFDHDGSYTNPEMEYARLRRFGASCVKALQIVCATPLTRLRPERRIVMPHQTRRIDTMAVQGLARSPAIAAVLGHRHADAYKNCRINAPFVEHTVDNAANRAMAAVVDRLLSRVANLMGSLEVAAKLPMNPIAPKVARRMHVLRALREALRRVRRSPTLSAVTRSEFTATGLNAISSQPDYAHAFQLAWKALRGGIEGDDASDTLPVSPTWEIYERWCFLQVTKALERLCPDVHWKLTVSSSIDAIRVEGKTGSSVIGVWLQARFRAWDVAGESSFRSLSGERAPDIVVTTESARGRRFLVLDAKYRASRSNVLDAMQSAHLYRDSLLWGETRPWKSLLLIPRHGGATWLEGLDFQDQYHVGTVEVADSDTMQRIEQLLEGFLAAV